MLEQGALAALNHLLQAAPWATARLAPFAGRAVRVHLPPWHLDVQLRADGLFETLPAVNRTAFAVVIHLPADAPFLALQGAQALQRAVRIEGSADLAEALSFVLRHLSWDYEEDLSHYLGDIAAHRLARGLRHLTHWHQQVWQNLTENVVEYLSIEQSPQPSLVRVVEAANFYAAIKQLQEQTDALEQRIAACQQNV